MFLWVHTGVLNKGKWLGPAEKIGQKAVHRLSEVVFHYYNWLARAAFLSEALRYDA